MQGSTGGLATQPSRGWPSSPTSWSEPQCCCLAWSESQEQGFQPVLTSSQHPQTQAFQGSTLALPKVSCAVQADPQIAPPSTASFPSPPWKPQGFPGPCKGVSPSYTSPQWPHLPHSPFTWLWLVCNGSVSSPQLQANRSRNSDGLGRSQPPLNARHPHLQHP